MMSKQSISDKRIEEFSIPDGYISENYEELDDKVSRNIHLVSILIGEDALNELNSRRKAKASRLNPVLSFVNQPPTSQAVIQNSPWKTSRIQLPVPDDTEILSEFSSSMMNSDVDEIV